ncbi:winged helix-turn-helix transcriptional regulator [Kitasatospora kifunensis]|uniref:DNA-binding HxlR family transcriptional regulator n=1 Tax=Kitasatospora kifunensis TaxID=58351 RepID=A0A7W7R2Z0_KITKI|nr:helix-turn-helix domain-containing protein [Kitasatospora kifunensis]MBB4924214.1 DNA-binding HxlR family transcriptional regulator [Kitasatospora kifunensis]
MSAGHTAVTTELFSDPSEDCGVRDVLDRLGDKWSVQVLVELSRGVRRFRELQRAIPGDISQRMLTLTVRRLERDGMVRRTVHATVPPQVDYELTELGRSLAGLIRTMSDWSAEHHEAIVEFRRDWDAAHPDAEIR